MTEEEIEEILEDEELSRKAEVDALLEKER